MVSLTAPIHEMIPFCQGGKIHIADSTKSEVAGHGFDFEDGGTVDCKVCIVYRDVHVLKWRTVYALTTGLFWSLFI